MKLFENGVGRPSNEILKKRKIFKISVLISVIAIIIGTFSLGYFNIINLRGASYAAGAKITINKVPIYSSATSSSKAGTKTGTFYIWNSYVKNNRIRITTKKEYVGKSGKITGWINVSSINSSANVTTTKTTAKTTTTKTTVKTFKAGDAVKLSKTPIYITSKIKTNAGKKTGTYYIYSSSISNGRIKITGKKSYVGKGIITGWVEVKNITKVTQQVYDDDNNSSSTGTIKTNINGFATSWKSNTYGTISVTLSDSSDSYTATSSNSSVMNITNITKSGFRLNAKSAGSATITIKSNNTGKYESRTFTVKATNSGSSSNAIKLSHSTGGTIKFGAGSTVKVTLSDSSDSYTVSSSNQGIVAVTNIKKDSFKFKGIAQGTASITVTSTKTGQTVSLNYTVEAIKLPSSSDFGSNGKNITKKGTYNTLPVYVEKGCSTTNVNNFINDIKQFDHSKTLDNRAIKSVKAVYMVSSSTFNTVWKKLWPSEPVPGSSTNGLSSSGPLSFIILKCDRYYSHTMSHEIGHSLDARYGVITGTPLSNDLSSLYNSYNKKRSSALRTYSYGNVKEFFADSFARYRGEASWSFPTDLKNKTKSVLDKVINLKAW